MPLRLACACIALLIAASAVRAQRLQLPSRIPEAASTFTPTQFAPNTSTPLNSPYLPPGNTGAAATNTPSYTPSPPAATFSGGIQPFDPYATSSTPTTAFQPGAVSTNPIYPPAGPSIPVSPSGVTPPVVTPPAGAPYYTPGAAPPVAAPVYSASPPALYPSGAPSILPQGGYPSGLTTVGGFTRFLQEIRLQHEWIMDNDDPDAVEINSTEVNATFAVPLFNYQTPFLFTPGFALHLWDGPVFTGPGSPDLPAQTYDAYLDVGWNPQMTNWLGAELGARVGVYTDFDHFSPGDSIRVMGRGLGVVKISPTLTAKAGVIYIDRNDIKLLPAGGVIWDPSPDRHFEIFFPRPKLARRWITLANHNLWYYVAGEYGGGAWTIVRQEGFVDDFDYNDLRVLLGLEWLPETESGARGFIEIGYVFNRELFYTVGTPRRFDLDDTVMFRGGVAF